MLYITFVNKASYQGHSEDFLRRIDAAEEVLDASLASIERKRGRGVTEKIDRLRLFRKLLINIRMNASVFEHAPVPLRINQLHALQDFITFLENEGEGDRIGYFVQPSGAGKTVLYGAIARLLDVQTLVLVPRSNLLEQVKQDWTETLGIPEAKIGLVGGNHDELGRQYTITNYQSHLMRMKKDPRYKHEAQGCELVLCDEAHKSLGPLTSESIDALDADPRMTKRDEQTEASTLSHLSKHTSKRALKLGFTATPRLREKSVRDRFKTLVSSTPYSELVQSGILVKFKVLQVPASIYADEVEGKITRSQEVRILSREDVHRKALEALLRLRDEVRERLLPLAFCSTIKECDRFQETAKKYGLSCTVITGREYNRRPKVDHIAEAERKLLDGNIDLIASVDKLQVGWDFPPLNTILQMRATLSAAILAQEAGRASRVSPGKHVSYVIEPQWRRKRISEEEIRRNGTIIRRKSLHLGGKKSKQQPANAESEDATPFYWETETLRKRRVPKGSTRQHGGPDETLEDTITQVRFHKTPLTLADAFDLLGEEQVDEVCEGLHGEKLKHGTILRLDEQGTVRVNNEVAVGLSAFALLHQLDYMTLLKEVAHAKLEPIQVALSHVHYVPVYKLIDIQSLAYVCERLELERLSTEGGEVLIEGSPCVGLNAFAVLHQFDLGILQKHVERAGLKPVGQARNKKWSIPVYKKSEIEALPYVQHRSQLKELDPDTQQVEMHGQTYTNINSFAQSYGLTYGGVEQAIHGAHLSPAGQARQHGKNVDVYPVSELQKLPYVHDRSSLKKISEETAEVQIRGRTCIALNAFCDIHGLQYTTLRVMVEREDIKHVGFALGRMTRKVKVYNKDQILNLPWVQEKLSQQG